MKYDGKCLHGAGPGKSGDCTEPRKEDSCLCELHHQNVLDGLEKAPPLRMTFDYQYTSRRASLVEELPEENRTSLPKLSVEQVAEWVEELPEKKT